MAQQNAATAALPGSYERLGMRIQKIINSPAAQKARTALLLRQAGDLDEDWGRLLEEIAENDNVTLAWRDDGGVQLFWTLPAED
ncbi:DUF1654 domain-containing protein [Pseudomonas sp. DTU_2021_1001937_2_SI_NGA_ILE_001]|uniref:DUF1654 domain-containing protein n=1 Tax=Pseudomonas sp. DTU_2021_1001937_2_SI_NGA_ILE_001 TaxID=3077589 RepID=UPI0028FC1078|nr:DUF1654 domain-containing protein [Pseudomonas sp. DTU_2021_1001937_2_SI_NGA_ILE_001]WNW10640.1 DUF1654 domain-containing protein [Pseudomonas sp. DTU_2021_1001937_2_SI_NGA_ILE_001]